MADGKSFYSIGKVSSLCCVPIKTLRYYDKIGLLVPEYRKDESNYRYYSQDQILTLFIIRKLRMLGIPLKEIHEIIDAVLNDTVKGRLLMPDGTYVKKEETGEPLDSQEFLMEQAEKNAAKTSANAKGLSTIAQFFRKIFRRRRPSFS